MTFVESGPRFRSRTHELRPFWDAMATAGHRRYDDDVRTAEWAYLPPIVVGALLRAGFTCQRQVEACPDWLLLTVTQLGRVGLRSIRHVLPYRRDIFRRERCPGHEIERARAGELHFEREMIEDLARAAARELMIERVLYGDPNTPMEAR